MHEAARRNYPEILKLLLEYNSDLEAVDLTGYTALHYAMVEKNYTCVKLLLQKFASPWSLPGYDYI